MQAHKKTALSAILAVLFAIEAFAVPSVWVTPEVIGPLFNVDLASDGYCTLKDDAKWKDHDNNKGPDDTDYYQTGQIIGYAGVSGSESEASVEITFTGDPWHYVSQSDPVGGRREFGVAFVIRGSAVGEDKDVTVGTEGVARYGHHRDGYSSSTGQTVVFTLPCTDGETKTTVTTQSDVKKELALTAAWVDIILVLDPALDTSEGDPIAIADDYIASFTAKITSGGQSTSSPFIMTGHYRTNSSDSGRGNLSLMVNSMNYNSLNLSENLSGVAVDSYGQAMQVGTYNYVSVLQENSAVSDRYHIFIHPSEDITKDGNFLLRLSGTENQAATSGNSIPFMVVVESELTPNGNKTAEFTGQKHSSWVTSGGNKLTSSYTSLFVQNNDKQVGLYQDNGTISIQLKKQSGDLLGGSYSSEIYVHVVSKY